MQLTVFSFPLASIHNFKVCYPQPAAELSSFSFWVSLPWLAFHLHLSWYWPLWIGKCHNPDSLSLVYLYSHQLNLNCYNWIHQCDYQLNCCYLDSWTSWVGTHHNQCQYGGNLWVEFTRSAIGSASNLFEFLINRGLHRYWPTFPCSPPPLFSAFASSHCCFSARPRSSPFGIQRRYYGKVLCPALLLLAHSTRWCSSYWESMTCSYWDFCAPLLSDLAFPEFAS